MRMWCIMLMQVAILLCFSASPARELLKKDAASVSSARIAQQGGGATWGNCWTKKRREGVWGRGRECIYHAGNSSSSSSSSSSMTNININRSA